MAYFQLYGVAKPGMKAVALQAFGELGGDLGAPGGAY